jgi:hypothetical protein
MHIIAGVYHYRPRRLAFRNDYCLACGRPGRSVQSRTFDVLHIFWIPLLPLGLWKRWLCAACGREPHLYPGTRRSFKWAGLVVVLFFSAAFWAIPVDPDFFAGSWVIRIAGPLGAILILAHLLRTPRDPSLRQLLSTVPPASDTACPFCGVTLLISSTGCACPLCGVARA